MPLTVSITGTRIETIAWGHGKDLNTSFYKVPYIAYPVLYIILKTSTVTFALPLSEMASVCNLATHRPRSCNPRHLRSLPIIANGSLGRASLYTCDQLQTWFTISKFPEHILLLWADSGTIGVLPLTFYHFKASSLTLFPLLGLFWPGQFLCVLPSVFHPPALDYLVLLLCHRVFKWSLNLEISPSIQSPRYDFGRRQNRNVYIIWGERGGGKKPPHLASLASDLIK